MGGATKSRTEPAPGTASRRWRLFVDTGGTFTDCLALDPDGNLHRAKVLSSGIVRTVGSEGRVETRPTGLEAPLLAAHQVTGTPIGSPLPPCEIRLATTKGTNALLTRSFPPPVLVTNRGLGDVARIGTQQRPNLFARTIQTPAPIHGPVLEIDFRRGADGTLLAPLDTETLREDARLLAQSGHTTAAVSLIHGWRHPDDETIVAQILRDSGFTRISTGSQRAPFIHLLSRTQTAVVDAALAPVMETYLDRVAAGLPPATTMLVSTSTGGLVPRAAFHPKDSLLSGPAGGVVGAAHAAQRSGFPRCIAFDMGGTSTDVARIEGGNADLVYEHAVGDAKLLAPALAIESVAAGGGSICSVDPHGRLRVGPESAGADPGPACYGMGGPLTVTDVNLLLGRLDPAGFGIPVDPDAAETAFQTLCDALTAAGVTCPPRETLLTGLLELADEAMADAIRSISVRRGVDPRDHALVAFGGAGGLHAAGVASRLGIRTVLVPPDAGLLSAWGLAHADVQRHAEAQVLAPLAHTDVDNILTQLEDKSRQHLIDEGAGPNPIRIARRVVRLRLAGQETALDIDTTPGEDLETRFRADFAHLYGYPCPDRPVEVESIRVSAALAAEGLPVVPGPRAGLALGETAHGPKVLAEAHGTTFVPARWSAHVDPTGALILTPSPLSQTTGTETTRAATTAVEPQGPQEPVDNTAEAFPNANEGTLTNSQNVTEAFRNVTEESLTHFQDVTDGFPNVGAKTSTSSQSNEETADIDEKTLMQSKTPEVAVQRNEDEETSTTSRSRAEAFRNVTEETLTHFQDVTEAFPNAGEETSTTSRSRVRTAPDPVELELFTRRFEAIATDMGELLRRTSLSVNVKERLDYSCALLGPDGSLVATAAHIPVHLGALGACVRRIAAAVDPAPGTDWVVNHPAWGGSHLPDITVVSPVHDPDGTLLGWVASRAHHAEIGGTRPGSMPPSATTLVEEGVVLPPTPFDHDTLHTLLTQAPWPTRALADNVADLDAQRAANRYGASALRALALAHGTERIHRLQTLCQERGRDLVQSVLRGLGPGTRHGSATCDDGWVVQVRVDIHADGTAVVDFDGSSGPHPGNRNTPPAVVRAAVLFVLRMLVEVPVPLSDGLLAPVDIRIPEGTFLNPDFPEDPRHCPAVVGGNTEVSQKVAEALVDALGIAADSQGTMNNVLFGNSRFGYYETICGGAGATVDAPGASAVHTHMTNTRITDPEILETRAPVRVQRFAVRRGSGGPGLQRGGDGIVRELVFLEPLAVSVLAGGRRVAPRGRAGGGDGAVGRHVLHRTDGTTVVNPDAVDANAGDRLVVETPGGGGWGPA